MARGSEQIPSENVLHTESQMELGAAAPLAAGEAEELVTTRVSSPGRDAWRRFRRNRSAIISLAIIVVIVVMALFAPLMRTTNPLQQDYSSLYLSPSWSHWLGTDDLGRDLYSRLLYGVRVPLAVGLIGTAITAILGVALGVVSGFFGGRVDSVLSRFTDVMFAFPGFLLALIVVSLFGPSFDPYFGGGGRVILLTIVFAIVSWPPLMRFVRSLALSLKEQQFVEAARTSGTRSWKIIYRHLLPNMWGLVLVQCSFVVVSVINTETVLSIFGLGVEPPNPDLGQILYDGSQHLGFTYWEVLFASVLLTIIILSFTFVGGGVRDAVDPRGHS
jgi:ABC-type dipeptide/oligopeptide/nickel transport system permease subunit